MIVLSSIKLVVDTYMVHLPNDDWKIVFSELMDDVFSIIFALESLIHSIAKGLAQDKGSYLRESWN